ncbi:MAG: hypothetical protein V7L29_32850 [Nostoc sp.]|uniref:hypothetical protein n=1 Tax=Nostoc sp. TaxID=1180 RepID=UPI002FF7D6D9
MPNASLPHLHRSWSKTQSRANPVRAASLLEEDGFPLAHEISGQMFDDELDLAYAAIDGIEARGQRNNYGTERFKFNNHFFFTLLYIYYFFYAHLIGVSAVILLLGDEA